MPTATLPEVSFICFDCSKSMPVFPPDPQRVAIGYAVLSCGSRICYACADKRQVAELKDTSRPFVGYLAENSVTTWTGGKLMTVISRRSVRLTRLSYTHGQYIHAIRARDVHGTEWYGRGSNGLAIRLRACKRRLHS